jgi:predicted transcriptional regulator
MVKLVSNLLAESSVNQYKKEERSQVAKRIITSEKHFRMLIRCMIKDRVSSDENVKMLREQLVSYTKDIRFKRCRTMGHILKTALDFVKRNYLELE